MTAGIDHPDEHATESGAPDGYVPSTVFLVIVTVISAAADLVSKGWAKAMFSGVDKTKPRSMTVIANHFDFILRPRKCLNFATPLEVYAQWRHYSPVALGT